jgi:hypothetical protein
MRSLKERGIGAAMLPGVAESVIKPQFAIWRGAPYSRSDTGKNAAPQNPPSPRPSMKALTITATD